MLKLVLEQDEVQLVLPQNQIPILQCPQNEQFVFFLAYHSITIGVHHFYVPVDVVATWVEGLSQMLVSIN
jgi:hypothetical protein